MPFTFPRAWNPADYLLFAEPEITSWGRYMVTSVALRTGVDGIVGSHWIPKPATANERPEGYAFACAADCMQQQVFPVISG